MKHTTCASYKKIINVSDGLSNFSQRNNKVNPGTSCNTTAYTMAASYIPDLWKKFKSSPIYLEYSKRFSQEEDCLQQYILDSNLEPTIHDDLCRGFNDFINGGNEDDVDDYKIYSRFSTDVPIISIINQLIEGKPVVLSGTFPGYPRKLKTPLGHIVTLVGAIWESESDVNNHPDKIIIDDPYGNTINNWSGSGNDIILSWNQFINWFKGLEDTSKKWAHIFS